MNDTINRLAKGITETERPEAELSPASFSESVDLSESGLREFSLRSLNGIGLRGLVYSDNPRVRIENAVFTGGRNRIRFQIDTSFLKADTLIYGSICMITNAGEFSLPYRFTTKGVSVYDHRDEEEAEGICLKAEPDPRYLRAEGQEALSEFEQLIVSEPLLDEPLFSELVSMLIREQETGYFAFLIYQEAVKRDLRLARLYEYYIYSFPDERNEPIPREVLLYFSYDSTLDRRLKSVIYKNILQHLDPNSELYRHYEPEMRDYALQSVFRQKIDDRLSVIYAHMLYPDMIDEKAARVLPAILKAHLVSCRDSRMRKAVLRYPELLGEEVYPLRNGRAYVPVFLPDAELLFMDNYGRYYTGVSYTEEPVMDKPELLARCFSEAPDQPMVMLSAARRIVSKGIETEEEKAVLLDVLRRLPLREAFRERITSALLSFGGSMDFLEAVDLDRLPGAQKQRIFSRLVEDGEWLQAFEMLRRYGLLIAEKEPLLLLLTEMRRHKLVPKKDEAAEHFFRSACRRAFDEGGRTGELLSYLAEAYEGATEDMYAIFLAAEKGGLETAALLERILIAKLFAGTRRHLDEGFAAYEKKAARAQLVRAYLTVRSEDYFVKEEPVPESFFRSLSRVIASEESLSRLPSLYLLAWTKRLSEREEISDAAERKRAEEALTELSEEGLVFAYTKTLSLKLGIRSELTEKSYIEYHGDRFRRPRLLVRILPEDAQYREEELRRVYQGIYVREVQLFSDDELHYLIYDGADCEEPVQQGILSGKKAAAQQRRDAAEHEQGASDAAYAEAEAAGGTRYEMLDRMGYLCRTGNEPGLYEEMKRYILRDEMMSALFDAEP